jgi:Mg2+ and Co2+ transporter CorA
MIDLIVDNYFSVMEYLSDEIEFLEEELVRQEHEAIVSKNQYGSERIDCIEKEYRTRCVTWSMDSFEVKVTF